MAINSSHYIQNGQLNLAEIYGIEKISDNSDRLGNMISTEYQIPSLEQIAAYNQAVLTEQGLIQQPEPPESVSSSMQEAVGDDLMTPDPRAMYSPITRQDIMETPTPANTITSGATLSPSVRQDSESIPGIITDFSNPYPVTSESIQFLNGFIRTQIGRRVSIDFLVGSNTMVTKTGYLLGVATNYILLNELDTDDITACDFYNIKFIRFYY